MISGKDVRIENGNIIVNGNKYPIVQDVSDLEEEVAALSETVGDETSGLVKDVKDIDERVDTLEENSVSAFEKITGTSSVVTTGTYVAGFLKSNIELYSEFMFLAYCEDGSVAVPAPIILPQVLVQRVVDNRNVFSITNGTITLSVKPQVNVTVNYVNVELSGITTTDKRYYIEFYGRPVSAT